MRASSTSAPMLPADAAGISHTCRRPPRVLPDTAAKRLDAMKNAPVAAPKGKGQSTMRGPNRFDLFGD